MRTLTKTIYTVNELSPRAFRRAHEEYAASARECPWQAETMHSLKATVERAGLSISDYCVGPYNRGNFIKLRDFKAADLTGARAMAWMENNLLGKLRVPWTGKRRCELAQYGAHYRPGLVKPCPLTGYFADDDMLDSICEALRGGDTVREAFEGLADVAARIMEDELEAATSADGFRETAEANEWEYDEDGAQA